MSKKLSTEDISNKEVLKHIYTYGSEKTRAKWPILFILFTLYIACTISEPYIYQQIIDIVITNKSGFIEVFYGKIIYYIVVWGFIAIGGIISFAIYQRIVWNYLNIDSGFLAIYLIQRFLSLPIDTHSTLGSNEIQKTFDRTANGQWEIANAILNRLSIPLAILICMITLGLYTDVYMTIICLIPLPLGFLWLGRTGSRLSQEQSKANKLWDATLHRIVDALINIQIIKIFTRNSYETKIVEKKYDDAVNKQLLVNSGWAITESASEGFQLFVKIIVFSIGIFQVGIGNIRYENGFFLLL